MSDVDTAVEAEVEPQEPCQCGCGVNPKHKRSKFLPGHDAQLKAALYVTIRNKNRSEDDHQAARDKLDEYGWPQPSPKKARKPRVTSDTNGEATEAVESDEADEVTAEDL